MGGFGGCEWLTTCDNYIIFIVDYGGGRHFDDLRRSQAS